MVSDFSASFSFGLDSPSNFVVARPFTTACELFREQLIAYVLLVYFLRVVAIWQPKHISSARNPVQAFARLSFSPRASGINRGRLRVDAAKSAGKRI